MQLQEREIAGMREQARVNPQGYEEASLNLPVIMPSPFARLRQIWDVMDEYVYLDVGLSMRKYDHWSARVSM